MSTQYKDYYGTHMPFGQFPKFGVLSSVKVLMTGTNIAGPFAGCLMAEMGAQVIRLRRRICRARRAATTATRRITATPIPSRSTPAPPKGARCSKSSSHGQTSGSNPAAPVPMRKTV